MVSVVTSSVVDVGSSHSQIKAQNIKLMCVASPLKHAALMSKPFAPFFLFLACQPFWLKVGITGHKFGRGLSKDHSTKVWLQLAQWFLHLVWNQ
jgi:hypothetical protein